MIRGFFHSGIISNLLKANFKVVVLSPFHDKKELFQPYLHDNLILEPLFYPKKVRFEKFFLEMFKGVIFNKTSKVYYKYKFIIYEPKRYLYYPRLFIFSFVKHIPGIKGFLRWLDFVLNLQKEHDYLFKKYKPDLVFVTTPHERSEIGVIKSAKRFKVKNISMSKSWDNLSKILFQIKTDYHFVWSDFMKDEAMRFQDYKEDEIVVNGIPQFDFYQRKDWLLSREDFCKKFNFDPSKKIILYGSTGCGFDENGYLELIKKYIDKGEIKKAQVLMRPHVGYVGEQEKFNEIERYKEFVADRSDKQMDIFKDHWDISIDHIKNLYNSLYHADVCLNIASTLTLDSVACGTPVINLGFDLESNIPYNKSIRRVYETEYISAVIRSKGSWLVNNKKEFLIALQEVLKNKNIRSKEREEMIKYFMYKNDGKTAQRISEKIIALINN